MNSVAARMRGGSVGLVSGATSIAGHAAGGGHTPSETALVLLLLGSAGVGWLVAAHGAPRREYAVVTAALLAGQAVGHAALTLDHPAHGATAAPMLAGHLAAALVAAALIVGGTRAAGIAASALARVVPSPFDGAHPASPARLRPASGPDLSGWQYAHHGSSPRAPPVLG
ncbi:hypothetical protein DW322_00205 [Rhodococcus rhodnii]|uniref:Uncharacterized protein n=2 Tax=Rhodococcus rhodnii TaxID=38312 RepID=R7WRC9_9NOCA|nr:hypothetical protein [Rhodococcus rhodnii]EOM77878.1 hypothetical protein Rrhod_0771 [Rhodococcus rhodnii LMG 5362]TXG88949.1 hypothetical protein DW322_00205 [Rhodococcus rhodnii]